MRMAILVLLLWGLLTLQLFIRIQHPPVFNFKPLDTKRMAIGYFSIFILIISFAPSPFVFSF